MIAVRKAARWLPLAFLALTVLAWAGPAQAYVVTVFNSTKSHVKVEVFVIGPDLSCLGLGEKEIAPGCQAIWDSSGLCPGGLAGKVRTGKDWSILSETSCLGGARRRSDWTSCCRDLRFTVCPGPTGAACFCSR